MTSVFFSYSHVDEVLRDELEKHLSTLKRQGLIDTWHDRRILAGDEFDNEISEHLERANLILLLISADFISSKYCYDIEMKRALERHEAGEARIIPVILRACDWQGMPFGKLMATPQDGLAVSSWSNIDEAFLDIVRSIKKAIRATVGTGSTATVPVVPATPDSHPTSRSASSNLRLRRDFSEIDRDEFLEATFAFMADFFENSLNELSACNASITTKFRRIDNNCFTAVIYQDGAAISKSKIRLGGIFGKEITYSNDHVIGNGYNESLSVGDDGQNMFLKPMGLAFHISQSREDLTVEGAAEYYWSMLIQRLQ